MRARLPAILLGCIALAVGRSAAAACPAPVFDLLAHTGKPDLAAFGLEALDIVGPNHLGMDESRPDRPASDGALARGLARHAPHGNLLVLDIELWPLTGGPAAIGATAERLATIAGRVRAAAPERRIGLYGIGPVRDYWRALEPPTSPRRRDWQRDNDALAPAIRAVDALLPSLYTFYDDEPGWMRYAAAQLEEARRIADGRPVLAFLWPQYHSSNAALAHRDLPAAVWRRQLEFVGARADGVVIWGGWDLRHNRRARWDAAAPWWLATLDYLRAAADCAGRARHEAAR